MTSASRFEEKVFAPMLHTGRPFYLLILFFVSVAAWGLYGYSQQITEGLYVTALRDRVFWGLYVALFIYFLGISAGVTLVSSLLRLTHASWRAPITRVAEIVTISALATALIFIVLDVGRPDRLMNMVLFARWESQLMWDVYAVMTALMGRFIYLNFAMMRDLALCRDSIGASATFIHRWFFTLFAVGWRGSPIQVRVHGRTLKMMGIIIIPVAFMTPTISSWIFSMTLRDPWDSPMFAIYFSGGAVYSGIALIIMFLFVIRRSYGLQEFIQEKHFLNLGYLLAAVAALMLFFTVSDIITLGYKMAGSSTFYLKDIVTGGLSNLFWTYVWGGLMFPMLLIALPFTRNIAGIVVAAIFATVGILSEWYFVVMAGSRVPLNPYEAPNYVPTWVEWSLTAGCIAIFLLMVTLMLKLIPAVSIWEMELEIEDDEATIEEPVPETVVTGGPA